jgi:uncharacterized protein (DUF342 family)
METICKGRLSLEINATQTEAVLAFSADAGGETWTREKILSLLKKASVIEYANPVALEKALAELERAGAKSVRVKVAEGTAPAGDPEAIAWEENPIPRGLEEQAAAAIERAPSPRVYAWRYRKRRIDEGTGKGRAAAPRYVTEAIKQEKTVDPTVLATGFAAAGALVAVIGDAKEGLPGRTFRGEPIPAPPPGRPELFYGEGLTLREDKLYADFPGLLRIGANWVDLVPFAAEGLTVTAREDGSDCLLSFTPGEKADPIEAAGRALIQAQALGFQARDLLPRESTAALLRESMEKNAPLKGCSLCRPVDSACAVTVSADKMEATLYVRKHRGRGRPLALAAISARIKASGVTQFDLPQVREDVRGFFHDPAQRELKDYPLARGSPAQPGEAGTLEWEVRFISPAERTTILSRFAKQPNAENIFPSLKEFPVSAVEELAAVAPEGKIARLTPPARGQAGVDVFGRRLEGPLGRAVAVNCYEHVKKYGLYLVSEIQGYLEYGKKDGAYCLRVRPHQDAAASVEVALDGMQAFLSIRPHRGYGEPASTPQVYAVLAQERVTAGLKQKVIEEAVARAQDGREVSRLLVAEGKQPVHAEGPRLVPRQAPREERHVRILADGRADYKSFSNIRVVRAGEVVAEILPPRTRTENGFDVYGKPLPARLKAENALPQLVNVKQVPGAAGVVNLYAETEGEFVVTPTMAGVRQLHVVAGDVSLESGNIDFPGSVLVQGSVREGFRVFAKGSIAVNDLVEEAVLSAEGPISIQQGVKGRKNAVIRARADIACLFAEHALLMAVGDIVLERSALDCTIKCNGALTVGKTKGTLMGGIARARQGMTLVNLGSPGEARTVVSFGQDYILADQIEAGEKEVERLKARTLEIDRIMPKLPRTRPEDAAKLAALRDEKIRLLKNIETHNMRLFSLRERFEEHYPGAVTVRGTVYPGVIVESHGRRFTVRQEASGVQYTFDQKTGTIQEKPIVLSRRQPVRAPRSKRGTTDGDGISQQG